AHRPAAAGGEEPAREGAGADDRARRAHDRLRIRAAARDLRRPALPLAAALPRGRAPSAKVTLTFTKRGQSPLRKGERHLLVPEAEDQAEQRELNRVVAAVHEEEREALALEQVIDAEARRNPGQPRAE